MLSRESKPLIGTNLTSEGGFVGFIPGMMNRHGLIAGATGTGKTVTLQSMAETFSLLGIPVFATDMKGDLSGIGAPGGSTPSVLKRVEKYSLDKEGFRFSGCPVEFLDAFGEEGQPLRITISGIGPILLERILGLNETQGGVLNIAFRVADDEGLLLVDLDDLSILLRHVADNAKALSTTYGNVTSASVGAIQRAVTRLKSEGGDRFFGMPEFEPGDLFRTEGGKGVVSILSSEKLSRSPRIYTSLVLALLVELFESLPEVGDRELPTLIFFFDEAHLLFNDMDKSLQTKIEQIVRLTRSKGIGIYFITQSPSDIPDAILGQLGNRVLHALRAYTPKDQKTVRAVSEGFRPNPDFEMTEAILGLGTGEAIVSFLDEKGAPVIAQKVAILPPQSQVGPIDRVLRSGMIHTSTLHSKYSEEIDPESAFEILSRKYAAAEIEEQKTREAKEAEKARREEEKRLREEERAARRIESERKAGKSPTERLIEGALNSGMRSVANSLSRQLFRGIFGTLLGGKK